MSSTPTPMVAVPATSPPTLGGVTIRNTKKIITPSTVLCMMIYSPPKFGKTTFAASLNRLTKLHLNKPSLFIALEPSDGGGTMSIQDLGVDFVAPQTYDDYLKIVAALQTDTYYGGVILDSATEYVKRFLQPFALKFPSREHVATRQAGVPERSDYQTMGEKARTDFNTLIALTVNPNLNVRKHLIVTALQRDKLDGDVLTAVQPDLPGAMAGAATAMFNTVGQVAIRAKVEKDPTTNKPIRTQERYLLTKGDGVRVVGDRTHVFPDEAPLDLVEIWERWWLPRVEAAQTPTP